MPTRIAGTLDEVSYSAPSRGCSGAASIGPVDLFGGPFVTAYSIRAQPARGLPVRRRGAGALRQPLAAGSSVAAARVDAYANRVRVAGGRSSFATPRVGVSLGVGLAWDWAP